MKICVFGASSDQIGESFCLAARRVGEQMAESGHTLVFGGGCTGLMGECARGALSRCGEVIGIAPRYFDEPGVLMEDCTRFFFTETMSERKKKMEALAEGFLVLPGGIGTFDEFFETLTLLQVGQLAAPMVLLNTDGYYAPLRALLEHTVSAGFLSADVLGLCPLCGTPEEALAALTATGGRVEPRRLADYNRRAQGR